MSDELAMLQELIKEKENEEIKDNSSFFEIIQRYYDEDLISRMLAYVLKKDDGLCKKLLCRYFKDDKSFLEVNIIRKNIICEKSMSGKRADVFVDLEIDTEIKGYKKFVIVIENKIWSWEHDDQANFYYKWIEENQGYKKYGKSFFYLKPEANRSEPGCEKFTKITYKELYDMITKEEDVYIKDFKLLIENKLMNKEINFMDQGAKEFLFKNYTTIKDMISEVEDNLKKFKEGIVGNILNEMSINQENFIQTGWNNWEKKTKDKDKMKGDLVVQEADNESVYKFFKYGEWYDDDSSFYCEIKFGIDEKTKSPMSNICYQMTINKYYKNNDTIIDKFIKDCGIQYEACEYDQYYILKREDFSSEQNYDILTEDWKKELERTSVDILTEYLDEMGKIVDQYKEFKDAQKINLRKL